jgi:Ca-activated chloride channel family protein
MRFAQPEYLYALGLVPLLIIFYIFRFRQKAIALNRLGNPELLAKLSRTTSIGRQKLKAGLMVCSMACCLAALARPQFGTKIETAKRQGFEIIVALDVSNSMLVEDVKPNRLMRAKHAIRSLMAQLQGDRIGLVVFAGAAFLQCPMTSDYSAMELFLDGVDTETVGTQGTAISEALQTAMKAFQKNRQEHKIVVLITDGEDHQDDPVAVARELSSQGIRVYAVGIGTPFGEPIPIKNVGGRVSGHKRDEAGSVVMSRLDENTLQQIAMETEGTYYRSTLGENEIQAIYDDISELEKTEFESKEYTQYEERYQYILAFTLFFFILDTLINDRKVIKTPWMGRFE